MRRDRPARVLSAVLLAAAAGCDTAEVAECGRGELKVVDSRAYCRYERDEVPRRTDGTFACPPELPFAIEVADGLVCAQTSISVRDLPPQVCGAVDPRCATVEHPDSGPAPGDAGADGAGALDAGEAVDASDGSARADAGDAAVRLDAGDSGIRLDGGDTGPPMDTGMAVDAGDGGIAPAGCTVGAAMPTGVADFDEISRPVWLGDRFVSGDASALWSFLADGSRPMRLRTGGPGRTDGIAWTGSVLGWAGSSSGTSSTLHILTPDLTETGTRTMTGTTESAALAAVDDSTFFYAWTEGTGGRARTIGADGVVAGDLSLAGNVLGIRTGAGEVALVLDGVGDPVLQRARTDASALIGSAVALCPVRCSFVSSTVVWTGTTYVVTVSVSVGPENDVSLGVVTPEGAAASATLQPVTTHRQGTGPTSAAWADGVLYVVWADHRSGPSGPMEGIYLARFDANGRRLSGDERLVPTSGNPRLALRWTGDALVLVSGGGNAVYTISCP